MRLRTGVLGLVLIASVPACFGTFPVTRAVWKVNAKIPTPVLRSLVMWVGLPVYAVTAAADILVLNVIEALTFSDDELAVGESRGEMGGVAVTAVRDPDGRIHVRAQRNGTTRWVEIVPTDDGWTYYDDRGRSGTLRRDEAVEGYHPVEPGRLASR